MASPQSYLQQIPGQLTPYYQPYMDAGTGAMTNLQGQYGQLINDPGAKFNQIGQSFQQSPGFNWQMQQALQGANHAAAAGGMAGSPEHEQQNESVANNLANQDYYNYMDHVMPMYTEGLHGEQDLMHQGYNATKSLTDQIAQELSQSARLQYGENASKTAAESSIFGGVAEGASMAAMMKYLPVLAAA
jgi:hypothetical protein